MRFVRARLVAFAVLAVLAALGAVIPAAAQDASKARRAASPYARWDIADGLLRCRENGKTKVSVRLASTNSEGPSGTKSVQAVISEDHRAAAVFDFDYDLKISSITLYMSSSCVSSGHRVIANYELFETRTFDRVRSRLIATMLSRDYTVDPEGGNEVDLIVICLGPQGDVIFRAGPFPNAMPESEHLLLTRNQAYGQLDIQRGSKILFFSLADGATFYYESSFGEQGGSISISDSGKAVIRRRSGYRWKKDGKPLSNDDFGKLMSSEIPEAEKERIRASVEEVIVVKDERQL